MQFQATNNNYLSPATTLSDPFPNGIVQPAGSSNGAGTFLGQQITFYNPNAKDAYSMRANFGIQLPGQLVLEVAYIGTTPYISMAAFNWIACRASTSARRPCGIRP